MTQLEQFLAAVEARCARADPEWSKEEDIAQLVERDLPAALSLLRAFAAVVEEARKVRCRKHPQQFTDELTLPPRREDVESLQRALAAADAALAAQAREEALPPEGAQ